MDQVTTAVVTIYALGAVAWAAIWAEKASEWVSPAIGRRGVGRRRRMRMAWLGPVWIVPAAFFAGHAIWRNFSEAWLGKGGES